MRAINDGSSLPGTHSASRGDLPAAIGRSSGGARTRSVSMVATRSSSSELTKPVPPPSPSMFCMATRKRLMVSWLVRNTSLASRSCVAKHGRHGVRGQQHARAHAYRHTRQRPASDKRTRPTSGAHAPKSTSRTGKKHTNKQYQRRAHKRAVTKNHTG